ncbi:MAG: glycosyltransferase family 8 protein [Clostridia bacterium]|nr:glycosyltransferase family 8 protein [Clostridia bacterium]
MINAIFDRKSKKNFLAFLMVFLLGILSFFGLKHYYYEYYKKINIPIAMALDDGYLYPTIVSITSMMENKNRNSYYKFYIMHPGEFSDESKVKLKSLENKYSGCNINLIDMSDKYKNAYDKGHITTPAYYRLSLSDLFPDLDKRIWLDGDTLVFKDLRAMYNLYMTGLYYRGFLDNSCKFPEKFGIYDNDHYICDGVMVVNLKELRNDNMVEKFNDFIEKNNDRLEQHDQTVINILCYKKIQKLPTVFGFINYYSTAKEAKNYTECLIAKDSYSKEDMEYGFNNVEVLHCVRKPWKDLEVPFAEVWWEYAKKTDYFEEIKTKYPVI